MPFIHKAYEIHDAVQWWKDGDHQSVEKVADYGPGAECSLCGRSITSHGVFRWTDDEGELCSSANLCPGDYIVTMREGCEPETYSQELFNKTFLWRPEPNDNEEQPITVNLGDYLRVNLKPGDIIGAVTKTIDERLPRTLTTDRPKESKAYTRCYRCDAYLPRGNRFWCPRCNGVFCSEHIVPSLHFTTDRPGVTCATYYATPDEKAKARKLHQLQDEIDDLMHAKNLEEKREEQLNQGRLVCDFCKNENYELQPCRKCGGRHFTMKGGRTEVT